MKAEEIRQEFLNYFEGQGHLIVDSSSLIPIGDPTLLLTTAGMVQFKPYFSGEDTPPNKRLTSSQKSFRAVDIDEVGDSTHLTFFEMLGNFSIGDYFKEKAIYFALDFVTNKLHLEKDKFSATIYNDDEDSKELWIKAGIPAERIYRYGDEDNWWGPAGAEGPCGPCSELHYDFGENKGCKSNDCKPNCLNKKNNNDSCDRFVELWNLVFMQFYQDLNGKRTLLPNPSVDTGMGLERAAVILQKVDSIYDTDLFLAPIDKICKLSGHSYGVDPEIDYSIRVVAEHVRSATFLISDGVVPGNEGRGYVLRRVIRRAIRHGRNLGLKESFLTEISRIYIEEMSPIYIELFNHREFTLTVIKLEEERFQQAFERGIDVLLGEYGLITKRIEFINELTEIYKLSPKVKEKNTLISNLVLDLSNQIQPVVKDAIQEQIVDKLKLLISNIKQFDEKSYQNCLEIVKSITGKEAFVLWDTFGFPVEEIDAIAQENSLKVNLQEFNDEMEFQRNRARETAKFGGDRAKIRVYESLGVGSTGFMGYDHLEVSSVVVGLIVADQVVDEVKKGQDAEIALLQTSFYPEGGGQIGDSGRIFNEHSTINIIDTKTVMPGLIMHFGAVQEGVIRLGDPVEAQVNKITRKDCARNHTATHMLHAALRQVLGDHVRQAGSLVAPERIRFDFTHVKQLTNDELFRVQQLVNDKIRQNFSVHKSEDSYQSAIKKGALAFFGDKYENMVRVIEIANGATFSLEVCGGTHVERTGEIGGMYLLSETSVGAGVRRLEAITGRAAETLVWERFSLQSRIANQLQTNIGDLEKRIESLLGDLASTKQEKDSLQKQLTLKSVDPLLELVKVINGVKVLSVKISVNNVDSLREVGDYLRDKLGSCIVVLGCEMNKRANLIAMVTDDLVKNGFNASDIIRNIAKSIEGGGGGKENIAQAGGKRVDKLDQALADVYLLIEQNGMK
ncbi:MAG: alanine--tRNA ligase [Chloroflexi bacterium]|nr:alanine--tRNA ligase [Chloroflexota bacterium]